MRRVDLDIDHFSRKSFGFLSSFIFGFISCPLCRLTSLTTPACLSFRLLHISPIAQHQLLPVEILDFALFSRFVNLFFNYSPLLVVNCLLRLGFVSSLFEPP